MTYRFKPCYSHHVGMMQLVDIPDSKSGPYGFESHFLHQNGLVAEQVDAVDLESIALVLVGSNPTEFTNHSKRM